MHCPAVSHALAKARTQDLLAEAAAQRAGRPRRARQTRLRRGLTAGAIAVVAVLGASAGAARAQELHSVALQPGTLGGHLVLDAAVY